MCFQALHRDLQVAFADGDGELLGGEDDEKRQADLARRASRARMMRTLQRS